MAGGDRIDRSDVSARRAQLDEILAELMRASDGGETVNRDEWLARYPDFAAELQEYFDRHTRAEELFSPIREAAAHDLPNVSSTRDEENLTSQAKRIGPFKLLQQIGEGGMGSVWMAEQEEPVRRRVALKVIKAGMDSKQVIARFEAERQALAMMDHQNIAKVLDAGETIDGRPYFALELVQGIPITKYCDRNRLSLQERLELFVPVCKAVQHAHQKGIIHRDLKPSNVLVTLYDGAPVPKVIDFGLAKALQHQTKLTDKTMFTEFGQVVGTLQYMSPEQAEMNELDVDTRTDIYSLGVMLYELLAGSTPLDRETIEKNALLKVLQVIKETEPVRPSTRLSESGDAIAGISQQRKIEPKKLQQILHGDLDWIVMKALEKDRTRRYETANGLGMDVQRYLDDEAVVASPPSTAYRVRKFIKRNRSAVLAAALVSLALLLGVIGTSVGLVFAVKEKARAADRADEAEARFDLAMQAIEKYYTGVSEEVLLKQPQLGDLRVSLLQSALEFYEQLQDDLKGTAEPRQRAALADAMFNLAKITGQVGSREDAIAAFQKVVEIQQQLVQANPKIHEYQDRLAKVYRGLGNMRWYTGDIEGARESYERSTDIYQKLVADHPNVDGYKAGLALGIGNLGILQHDDDPKGAEELYQRSIEIFRKLVTDNPAVAEYRRGLGVQLTFLGSTQYSYGDVKAAKESTEQAIDVLTKLVADHPAIGDYRMRLAVAFGNFGYGQAKTDDPKGAKASYQRSIEIYKKLVADYPTVIDYQHYLARAINEDIWRKVVARSGSPPLTKEELENIREVCREHPEGYYFNTLAVSEYRMGNYLRAIEAAKQSQAKTTSRESNSYIAIDLAILAMSHFQLGNQTDATGFRGQLNDSMKQDALKDDKDCQAFLAEVNELFDSKSEKEK